MQKTANNNHQQILLVFISIFSILGLTALIVTLSAGVIMPLLRDWWLLALPVPLVLVGMHYRTQLSFRLQAALTGLMLVVVVLFAFLSLQIVASNIVVKPEWDLKAFWLSGRAAASGINFYRPELLRDLAAQYGPNSDLFLSQLNFYYPPPTMLLVLPMGWFDMETAILLWQIAHLALLVADAFLLWRLFMAETGWTELIFVGMLIAALHPTIDTVYAGQTNFLLLFLLLLYWRDRNYARAGIWLMAAVFVKPLAGILVLGLLLQRQGKILGVMIATGSIAAALSILVFGPTTFISYFTANPIGNMTSYMLTMPFNQSLLATILRLTGFDLSQGSGFTHPLFLVSAGLLTLSTAWLVYRCGKQQPDWTLALLLVLALLVYPHSLRYCAILLVPPILLIWSARERLPGGVGVAVVILSLLYGFAAYRPGDFIFVVMLGLWFILAFMTLRQYWQTMPAMSASIQ